MRSCFSSSFSCCASSLMDWCFSSSSSSALTCASLKRSISSSECALSLHSSFSYPWCSSRRDWRSKGEYDLFLWLTISGYTWITGRVHSTCSSFSTCCLCCSLEVWLWLSSASLSSSSRLIFSFSRFCSWSKFLMVASWAIWVACNEPIWPGNSQIPRGNTVSNQNNADPSNTLSQTSKIDLSSWLYYCFTAEATVSSTFTPTGAAEQKASFLLISTNVSAIQKFLWEIQAAHKTGRELVHGKRQ